MRKIKSLAIAAALTALCSTPASAATQITAVTGDYSATNGCSVISVGGYGGPGFNVVIYGVLCPNEPQVNVERKDTYTEWGNYCEMRSVTSGYITSSGCGYYSVWRL